MVKTFFIAPTALNSGLTSVCLGLVRALDEIGVRVGFFKPFSPIVSDQEGKSLTDASVHFLRAINQIESPDPVPLQEAQKLVSDGNMGLLMEKMIERFQLASADCDLVVVEGLVPDRSEPYTAKLNVEIARNLDSEVILVAAPGQMSNTDFDEHIKIASSLFADPKDPDVLGCILNKLTPAGSDLEDTKKEASRFVNSVLFNDSFKLIGGVPYSETLSAPRTSDVCNELGLSVLIEGHLQDRRVTRISVCARTVGNVTEELTPGTLVVTPSDRDDVILAASMAAINGVPLAGLLLTGDMQPNQKVLSLCDQALHTGMPLLSSKEDTFQIAQLLSNMNLEVPIDDLKRIENVMDTVASALDIDWLKNQCQQVRKKRLSPPAFRFQLSERSRAAQKTIILPEGNEPRTICAAAICHERGLAKCKLVGKAEEIKSVAAAQGVTLPPDIEIIDPDPVRQNYVSPMVELRKHKGLTADMALAQLEDHVVLATMMLALDEVDGLVSGAVHTTANTVRPAFQLIKTRPDAEIVSSVFFMCLPEQVLVYGDCAINPDPNAMQLADIAIQSAESAIAFGIEPKVAMISYSTGKSGSGSDVDKVRDATEIVKTKRPDLIVDGPLQYDAALIESVAKKKAPGSAVAGQATVFVFPDLNTGNTTYKAVQRSANVISMGPMLQGLNKPVNDLSRGALIEDIVFTIALTAVQAKQAEEAKNAV